MPSRIRLRAFWAILPLLGVEQIRALRWQILLFEDLLHYQISVAFLLELDSNSLAAFLLLFVDLVDQFTKAGLDDLTLLGSEGQLIGVHFGAPVPVNEGLHV